MKKITHTVSTADKEQAEGSLWMYDQLMKEIEPDLTNANIDETKKKLDAMTEDDRMVTLERYTYAFVVYDEALKELDTVLHMEAEEVKAEMNEMALTLNAQEETSEMQKIEQSLHDETQS